jgi:hypothetical protein
MVSSTFFIIAQWSVKGKKKRGRIAGQTYISGKGAVFSGGLTFRKVLRRFSLLICGKLQENIISAGPVKGNGRLNFGP